MTETAALDSIFELANHFELTPPGGHVTTWTAMVEVGLNDRDGRQRNNDGNG